MARRPAAVLQSVEELLLEDDAAVQYQDSPASTALLWRILAQNPHKGMEAAGERPGGGSAPAVREDLG